MSIHETNIAIERATSVEKPTDTTAERNIDLADAVDAAMLNINKICIVGSRYSDAVFLMMTKVKIVSFSEY